MEVVKAPAETIPKSPSGLKRLRGIGFTKKKCAKDSNAENANAVKNSNEGSLPTENAHVVNANNCTPSNTAENTEQALQSWFDPTTLANQVNAYFTGSLSSTQRCFDHNPLEDAKEYSQQGHCSNQISALDQAKDFIGSLHCIGFANCGSVNANHGSVDDRNDPGATEQRRADDLCEEQRQPDTTKIQRQGPKTTSTSDKVLTKEKEDASASKRVDDELRQIINEAKSWTPIFDSKSRRYYYYHKQTKAVRWDKPKGLDEAMNHGKNKSEWVTVDDMLEARKWWTAYDVNSDKYYYFDKDGNTSWKKPRGFDEVSKQRSSKRRSPK